MEERLSDQRIKVKEVERLDLLPAYETINALNIDWKSLPAADEKVISNHVFKALYHFRELSHGYMTMIVDIKRRRAVKWDKIISDNKKSLLVVSTMDVFV